MENILGEKFHRNGYEFVGRSCTISFLLVDIPATFSIEMSVDIDESCDLCMLTNLYCGDLIRSLSSVQMRYCYGLEKREP